MHLALCNKRCVGFGVLSYSQQEMCGVWCIELHSQVYQLSYNLQTHEPYVVDDT